MRDRSFAALVIVAVLLRSDPAAAGKATCLVGTDPLVAGDAAAIRAVRDLIEAGCSCAAFDGSKGKTHAQYVKCASAILGAQIEATALRKQCKGTVKRFYAQSTCGFAVDPRHVVCIKRVLASGKVTCAIVTVTKKDGTPQDKCVAKPTKLDQVACLDFARCIDAADTNADLLIAAPGDDGACNPSPTPTATVPATATPTAHATSTVTATATAVTPTPTATTTGTPTTTQTRTPTPTPTATPSQLLTVSKTGTGTVTSTDAGIACGATCSASYVAGQLVTLQARTTNGASSFFQGWSGGGCSGPLHDCTVTMDAAKTVTATFTTQTFNTVFVSSTDVAPNLGGTGPYDTLCNTLATTAGINNAPGNAYVAWLSDTNSAAATRLGTARGFVRMDGRPFADDQASLFTQNKIFNAVRFDENGADTGTTLVATGTNADGTVMTSQTCTNWTTSSASGFVLCGDRFGGPGEWTSNIVTTCNAALRILCVMRTKLAVLTPSVTSGKRIYLTNTAFTMSGGPDSKCTAEKPAGSGTVKALLAYTTMSASTFVSAAAVYVRPDGQVVGSGAELLAGGAGNGALQSGIWQTGDGTYPNDFDRAWTGQTTLTQAGSAASTCNDWTSTSSATGIPGLYVTANPTWWSFSTRPCTDTGNRLYCIEQ